MSTVVNPKGAWRLTGTPQLINNTPQRVLFLGQQITDTSPNEELITNIQPNGSESILFGQNSMLATMIRAYREFDQINRVDAIPVNDAVGSVAATSTVTFTGTATEAGTIFIYVQNKLKFIFQVPVVTGNTAIELGTAFAALVNDNDNIVVTATDNLDGTVTLTAVNAGTAGNFISIEQSGTVAGITSSITAFTGGATDPTITSSIFTQVGNTRYTTVIYPVEFNPLVISGFLDPRFEPPLGVLDGVGLTTETETSVNLQALALSINSQSMVLNGNRPVDLTNRKGGALFSYNPAISSYMGAIRSLRLTDGVNIPNLLISPLTASNPTGGSNVAGIPYANTPISVLPVIEVSQGWTTVEQNELNANGVSFLGNNIANNEVIFGTMVTTYLNNAQGQPDTTFKFLNTVDTGSQIREFYYNNNLTRYGQSTLTTGDVTQSYQVNMNSFNGFQLTLYELLSKSPYSLTVAGSSDTQFFKSNIKTTIDTASGTITTVMKVPIIAQVRTIDGTIEISFTRSTA